MKQTPIHIKLYPPQNAQDTALLQQRIAHVYASGVLHILHSLDWDTDAKLQLLEAVIQENLCATPLGDDALSVE